MDDFDRDYIQLVHDTQKRVHFIRWDVWSEGDYIGILQHIPIGDYIHRLPYSDVKTKRFRIAIPNKVPFVIGNVNSTVTTSASYLEFEAEVLFDEKRNSDFAWKRLL